MGTQKGFVNKLGVLLFHFLIIIMKSHHPGDTKDMVMHIPTSTSASWM